MTRLSRVVLLLTLSAAALSAQRAPIPQQLTFTPYHAGGIYDVGEIVGWRVTPGPTLPTYAYKWTIRRNNAVVLKEGKLDLSSGKATIEIVGDHGRKAGYPNWPSDNPDVMNTALYFDTVNFASRIKAPVLAGMGFIDTISPPAGVWTLLNQIPGPVEIHTEGHQVSRPEPWSALRLTAAPRLQQTA
jgi:acetyl xylan esterase AXE1